MRALVGTASVLTSDAFGSLLACSCAAILSSGETFFVGARLGILGLICTVVMGDLVIRLSELTSKLVTLVTEAVCT